MLWPNNVPEARRVSLSVVTEALMVGLNAPRSCRGSLIRSMPRSRSSSSEFTMVTAFTKGHSIRRAVGAGFVGENIERHAADLAGFQSFDQCALVVNAAAGTVD